MAKPNHPAMPLGHTCMTAATDLDLAALEDMAAHLEASGRYRLLRRFEGCGLSAANPLGYH